MGTKKAVDLFTLFVINYFCEGAEDGAVVREWLLGSTSPEEPGEDSAVLEKSTVPEEEAEAACLDGLESVVR